VQIIDGKGNLYKAKIVLPDIKNTQIEIISVQNKFEKRGYYLHLAIAPTKNMDRFEWFVEKAVEIGVDCITPLSCRFSERKVVNMERLEKIVISAAKQSLKAYLPKLNPITNFRDFILQSLESQRFIAHCYKTAKEPLLKICKPNLSALTIIGPEGDFSIQEVEFAENHCFTSVALGQSRLRTETAGIVACHTIAVVNYSL
jgi:16S rRNA (uracil1498-N3)-methyltransferase